MCLFAVGVGVFTVGIKRCKVLIYEFIVKNKSYIDEKAFGLVLYLVELYYVKIQTSLFHIL